MRRCKGEGTWLNQQSELDTAAVGDGEELVTALLNSIDFLELDVKVEAEAVAYVVGRYFGLDTSNSAFYLASWQGDNPGIIRNRLERVSSVINELIELIDR